LKKKSIFKKLKEKYEKYSEKQRKQMKNYRAKDNFKMSHTPTTEKNQCLKQKENLRGKENNNIENLKRRMLPNSFFCLQSKQYVTLWVCVQM